MLLLLQFFRKNLKQIETSEFAMQEWYSYVTEMSLEESHSVVFNFYRKICIVAGANHVIFILKFVLLLVQTIF